MASHPSLPVFWDEVFFEYVAPSGAYNLPDTKLLAVSDGPPDRPARNKNIKRIVEQTLADYVTWEPSPTATRDQVERVHDAEYVDSIKEFSDEGGGRLTAYETGGDEHTWEATRRAAGGAINAGERALESDITEVPYALVRPSGHHAQPTQADGYCIFNNVAIAAEHLLATNQVDSVAIIDWDVHHGNGTQEIFYDRDDVLMISLHNDHGSWAPEIHPQTGRTPERGVGTGEGYNVNIPLPYGTGDQGYEYAFQYVVEPIVIDFEPDLILVSAGQDPGVMDPLGRNLVTKSGFKAMGRRVRDLAKHAANGHLAIVQEGGYQITHLAFATLGVLEGALDVDVEFEDEPVDWNTDPFNFYDNEALDEAVAAIHDVREAYGSYWPHLSKE